ncbi:MFS transporter [Desulfovibrio desulfuricans]|uniref:MFS transporter n=1 Tax=Desulfovibrio desulfuricans TaxID=876 RepID=A0A4P7UKB2_DESDE|nr:MFS transporter [Desulfovibrio desulfuricans]QCC86177.1 MFS transporter [Desulfovibrio desulfuricans]
MDDSSKQKHVPSKSEMRKVVLASLLGATIEWYDFFLYGVVAGIVFNKLYFPTADPFMGTILAYSTFAIGYLARPLGGFIFGHYGDKLGRKRMLILTMVIMGIATMGIGIVPTYASIGIAAPILLQTLRLCQGLGLGGEWGGAVLMTYEYASDRQKAFYASIPQMGLATGLCLSSGMVALLSWLLDNEQFLTWGWRFAFLISVVLIAIALYVRTHILETPEFRKVEATGETRKKTLPIVTVCQNYPGNIALGVGARWIDGVFFNVLAVFSITYLVQQIHTSRTEALTAVMIAALIMCPFILIAGRLADRFGRGNIYGLASLACGISVFPSFWLMQSSGGNMFLVGLAIAIPLSIFYAGVFGPEAALFSDLFPAEVRYTGISIVYQFPGFLVAGIVPGVCTALIQWNDGDPFYICIFVLIAAATSAFSAFTIQARHNRLAARAAGTAQD